MDITEINVFKLGTEVRNRKLSELINSPNYIGSINLTGEIYCLDKCKIKNKCIDFSNKDATLINAGSPEYCPFSTFTLIPFIFKDKTYIAIRDAQEAQPVKRNNNWIIVSQYMGGFLKNNIRVPPQPRLNENVLDDICYIKKN